MKETHGFSAGDRRFQVKDVFRFGSNQLFQAETGDGTVVYVQEIPLRKPLPPRAASALKVDLRHVSSILDVIYEKQRVKLIHPPLRGDPLSTVVSEKAPMKPLLALEVCRKLLSTLEELEEQSLPLASTCDPRNVCLENGEPYFLFLWIKGYTEPPEEKWRELLFFLLTGGFPKKGEGPDKAVVHERIPEPLRALVADSLNPKHSRKEILKRVQEEILRMKREQEPPPKRTPANPLMRWKKGLLAAAISLALLAGGIYGIWTLSESQAKEQPDDMQRAGISFDDRRQEYVWPEKIQGASLIRGSFIPRKGQPFSVMLTNREYRNSYGFSVDEGRLLVLMSSPDIWYSLVDSEGMLSVEEGSVYNFEITYIPDKPIRYSIWKKDDTRRWVAVGNTPAEHNFQIHFQGGEGTKLLRSEVIAYGEREKKSSWQLSQGSALIQGDRWKMGRSSRVRVNKAPYSFRFLRPEGDASDPVQLVLSSGESNLLLVWGRDGYLRLYENDEGEIASSRVGWDWEPGRESTVVLSNASGGLRISVMQGSRSHVWVYDDRPFELQQVIVAGDDRMELIPSSSGRIVDSYPVPR
ncbi:hypothetical protein CLV97_12223 [Planifilum fimeticola]|uniref:Uncharacterized protein n=1 Tax=Planifilum fimeticola TaxID=201975 RepID=A0A2T0LCD1_9BACL|nr:hypothetical protein [Planifilum fimeticola]PRX39633.1 hypothetical protein CLV97_12223 [Planifilum fimeticola]